MEDRAISIASTGKREGNDKREKGGQEDWGRGGEG